MKLVIVALALVAVAVAAPQGQPQVSSQVDAKKVPQIVRSEFDQNPDGGYQFSFESEDGIKREENGELKELKDEDDKPVQVVVVRGQYSYTDSEGKPQTITYYADETGFHAEGDAVPKAPARR